MKLIKFERSTANITLADLQTSAKYENAGGGLPRNRPIEHTKLFELIVTLAAQFGITATVGDITIHEGKSMLINHIEPIDPEQGVPIEKLVIQRAYGIVRLGEPIDIEGEQMCPSIAVVYDEEGIKLGFGINVRICDNMNIYGAYLLNTQDEPFEHCQEIIKGWMQNTAAHWEEHVKVYRRCKGIKIHQDEVFRIYGKLFSKAVDMNEGRSVRDGLNVSQVTALVKNLNAKALTKECTVWDLLQSGTNGLKPESTSFNSLLKVNKFFGDFVLHEYNIVFEEPKLADDITDVEFENDSEKKG